MPTRMKLTDIDLIDVLKSPTCIKYFQEFKEKNYSKKEILFTPDESNNLVFLIKKGRVRVYLANEDKEFTLSILESGDIFSTHTRAFCQALEDTSILIADIRVLKNIVTEVPDVALVMVRVLGDLLKNSITIINGLAFKETRMRLAEFLLRAAEDKGRELPEGIKVEIGLNTEELAMIIGSTRQTVSTLLNDLRKTDILKKIDRRSYLIIDLEMLKKLSVE